ncbi:MAG: carbohydrate kinase [Oscillatoriales cyanobacterium CG2_30_44_21]|nr:MAG: carbohydrate kinase [Oscillatoriales cyanobacterium CG2_30_44_21]
MKYWLGIDFGTSGVRAIAINGKSEVVALSRVDYEIGDWQTWQRSLYQVIIDLPIKIRKNIQKIVIDGTSATTLICDRQGKPIFSPMLYGDTCAAEILNEVKAIAPPQHLALSSSSSFAKLLTLTNEIKLLAKRSPNSVSQSPWYFLHQADWLGYLLHGKLGVSDYHNALKLGYDQQALTYPDWLLAWSRQNPAIVLPEIFAPAATVGTVQGAIAAKLGLSKSCEVGAGTTDSNAAFLASIGKTSPKIGTAVTSLGSTMVLKVLSDRPINHPNYGIYSHRFEYDQMGCLWLVGGASNVGGAVLKHFFSNQQLLELSDRLDPNIASPLDYYPLLKAGDRFPINDPQLQPRLHPRPDSSVDFLHGLLESMARIEAQGYGLLQQLGVTPIQKIYTVGGGAQNQAWTKIRYRHLQIPLLVTTQTEAAYGSALLAKIKPSFKKQTL